MKKTVFGLLILAGVLFSCDTPVSSAAGSQTTFLINYKQEVFPDSNYTDCGDTYISSGAPGSNFGNNVDLYMGSNGIVRYRILLRFELNEYLPANAVVKKAVITLVSISNLTDNFTVTAHALASELEETSDTWIAKNTSIDSTPMGTGTGIAGNQVLAIELDPALVEEWITSPFDLNGIMLKIENESDVYQQIFYSRNYSIPSYRPMLTVEYSF
ncbi:MAG: DNRLRE domain-containing protein [Spirochaetales bacterium]|nr:DNRLRE domain-containing protein [Spirochaetales bacterium]